MMNHTKAIAVTGIFFFFLCLQSNAQISGEDQDFLRDFSKKYLSDPTGKKRVKVYHKEQNCWANAEPVSHFGWLDEKTGLIYFTYKETLKATAADSVKTVNFPDSCKKVYKKSANENRHVNCYWTAGGSDVALAAWLLALGENELAAKALAAAKATASKAEKDTAADPAKQFREWANKDAEEDIAWDNFSGMVHNYMVRKDSIALDYGRRLNAMVKVHPYRQADAIIAELERRKKENSFGKAADTVPPGFAGWDQDKKIDFLIHSLEEVDARQWGQPGGVSFEYHWVSVEFLKIGESAVPKLIDVIDSDNRLTRSVHFWRDFSHDRTVLGVYEVALSLAMTILQTEVFSPASTGDNFSKRGMEMRKKVADELRAYWAKFGKIPYDERLMTVITDTTADMEKVQEAVENISQLQMKNYKGTTVFVSFAPVTDTHKVDVVKKYNNPTTAEAILKAFDRNMLAHEKEINSDLYDYEKRHLESKYLYALVDLGDRRMAKEMNRRYYLEKNFRLMRKYAIVAFSLGDTLPLLDYAAKVEKGELDLPAYGSSGNHAPEDEPSSVELREIIYQLSWSRLPACLHAVEVIAQATHPYHEAWEKGLKDVLGSFSYETKSWLSHPVSLHYVVELARTAPAETSRQAIRTLRDYIYGFPEADMNNQYFLTDPFKKFLNQYHDFRLMSPAEQNRVSGIPGSGIAYVANITTGDRAATGEDLRNGKAIFSLEGKGKRITMKLPATGIVEGKKSGEKNNVLILQAEQDEKGTVFYGIINEHEMQKVPAAAVSEIKAVD